MEAVFLCPVDAGGSPILPPHHAGGVMANPWGCQISYQDANGLWHGAWSVTGTEPDGRARVWIDTSPETVAALEADARFERVADV